MKHIGDIVKRVAGMTIIAIVISLIVSTLARLFAGAEIDLLHFAMAVGMPVALVPPVLYPLVRMNDKLRETRNALERLSLTDPLTGLANRRAFFDRAKTLLATAGRDRLDIAVMMIDIDDFKEVNDCYGHDVGDAVLQMAAKTVEGMVTGWGHGNVRLVARIGGEEFAVLLSEVDQDCVPQLAEAICQAVRTKAMNYDGHALSLTVSIGVAMHRQGTTIDATLKAADIAVYQAKKEGRDRWCQASPSEVAETLAKAVGPVVASRARMRVA